MDEWRFVSDSSYDPDPAEWDYEVPLGLAPLTVTIDGEDFVDLPGTDLDRMIDRMSHCRTSSTSCPSVESFAEQFRKAKNVICVAMTSQLSGTYNSALRARDIVLEEDPERRICVVDSHGVAGVHVLLLREARRLHAAKVAFSEMCERLNAFRDDTHILFSLATFHNWIVNGRISRAVGTIATALRIRPIATNSPEGKVKMLEKPRGVDNMLRRMCALVGEMKDVSGKGLIVNYVDDIAPAQRLCEMLRKAYPGAAYVEVARLRCLCSYYADRGGILLSF